jgi:hypothetical protein
MGCDFVEETCLEIILIDPITNTSITSYYVMEDFTKYKYFQIDSADFSDNELELVITFQPIEIVSNGKVNYEMDLARIAELNLFEVCGTYSVCEWIRKYMLDWINKNTFLEEIIQGKYKSEFNSKITGIKLIKRSCYLDKYYYYT